MDGCGTPTCYLKVMVIFYWVSSGLFLMARGHDDECFDGKSLMCSDNVDTGALRFTGSLANNFPYCEHGASTLSCCVSGNVSVMTWQFRSHRDTGAWSDVTPSSSTSFCEHNQVLMMKGPLETDAGYYRCTAEGVAGANITHDIRFEMHACAPGDPDAIQIMKPADGYTLTRNEGENVTLECEAFLGRNKPRIIWKKLDASNTSWSNTSWIYLNNGQIFPENVNSERFSAEIAPNTNRNYFGVFLRIHNLQASDFGQYECNVVSFGDPKTSKIFLNKTIEVTIIDERHMATMTALISVFVVFLLSAAILYVTRLYWGLAIKDQFSTPDRADRTFDAFIVHDSTNAKDSELVVNVIHAQLHDKLKYRLAHAHNEMPAGGSEIHNYEQLINDSQCILYIVSEFSLKHGASQWVFQNFYEKKDDRQRMIFLMVDPIPEHAWQPENDALRLVLRQKSNVIHIPRGVSQSAGNRGDNFVNRMSSLPQKSGDSCEKRMLPLSHKSGACCGTKMLPLSNAQTTAPQSAPKYPTSELAMVLPTEEIQQMLLSDPGGQPLATWREKWAEDRFWKQLRLTLPAKLSSYTELKPAIVNGNIV